MLCFTLLVKITFSYEISQPSQASSMETNYAPRPSSTNEKYLSGCADKLKPNCSKQIFFSVFIGNQTVCKYCCHNLVKDVEKACHTAMTKYHIIKFPEFKQNQTQILNRSEKIWNDCTLAHFPSFHRDYGEWRRSRIIHGRPKSSRIVLL